MADREVLHTTALTTVGIVRKLLGYGQVRFYLRESEYVREFSLPPLLPFLEHLRVTDNGR